MVSGGVTPGYRYTAGLGLEETLLLCSELLVIKSVVIDGLAGHNSYGGCTREGSCWGTLQ